MDRLTQKKNEYTVRINNAKWYVEDMLRKGLTEQQIAERIGGLRRHVIEVRLKQSKVRKWLMFNLIAAWCQVIAEKEVSNEQV